MAQKPVIGKGVEVRNRDALRERYGLSPNGFLPWIAVRRRVIVEDGAAKARKDMQRKLRKLPASLRKHTGILPVDEWSMTIVEKRGFEQSLRDTEIVPTTREMKNFSAALQLVLQQALVDTPGELDVPIGMLARFGRGSPKKAVGLQPDGWRGPRRRYAREDRAGNINPLAIFAAERAVCETTFAQEVFGGDEQAASNLTSTPHITVLRNGNGIRDHEFEEIRQAMAGALPDELTLTDPFIEMRTDRGSRRPVIIPIRPQIIAPPVEQAA